MVALRHAFLARQNHDGLSGHAYEHLDRVTVAVEGKVGEKIPAMAHHAKHPLVVHGIEPVGRVCQEDELWVLFQF